MNATQPLPLYDRLGRFDGITRIVHDAMEAHLANPVIAPRLRVAPDLDHARKIAVEFFSAGCGGPECYTGRDLLTAHRGMNFNQHKSMAATRGEVTSILYSLKGQVVRA